MAGRTKRKASLLWRFVGFVGELFITAGIVIGLFVVWQVWWTDIGANREQATAITQQREAWVEPGPQAGTPRTDAPPAFPHTDEEGSVLGIMRIPRFGADYQYQIAEGTSLEERLGLRIFRSLPGHGVPR